MRILLNTLGFNDEKINCFLQSGNINPGEAVTSAFPSPSRPSRPSRPIYGNLDANITGSSTYDQVKLDAISDNVNEHLQLRDVAILDQDAAGLASTGYLSSSQTHPCQAQGELSQYTQTLNQLADKPLVHASQCSTSSSHQDDTIYEQSFETGHMADPYSNLSHTSTGSIDSIAADALLPATLQHSQTHLDYVSPVHYGTNNSDDAGCLPSTSKISPNSQGSCLSF
ncbi:hypothetical protein F4813DRAFT_350983 [Daldinia decipiens]|uniref:uncharacterized protein n=1 Tax=Daldinia decipiens TaxID=326647 RepID=UPI0020C45C70|nr:uncharacterized protein F4813DRAFT_350983 [Daldinia decipiens]KAI1660106.1 hypothetical protein F4813DRAFT_350983 [Daldinia decipiens]